eukprot:Hpha_TRINITY_DN27235_c0_g1::TRINITY_DN27235_c0_g1_i1::g.140664::m.140664
MSAADMKPPSTPHEMPQDMSAKDAESFQDDGSLPEGFAEPLSFETEPPLDALPRQSWIWSHPLDQLLPFRSSSTEPPDRAISWGSPSFVSKTTHYDPEGPHLPQTPEGHPHADLLEVLRWVAEEGSHFIDGIGETAAEEFKALVSKPSPGYFPKLVEFLRSDLAREGLGLTRPEASGAPHWVRAEGVAPLWWGTVVDCREEGCARAVVFAVLYGGAVSVLRSLKAEGKSTRRKLLGSGVLELMVSLAVRPEWNEGTGNQRRLALYRRTLLHRTLVEALARAPEAASVRAMVYILRVLEGSALCLRSVCYGAEARAEDVEG